MKTTSLRNTLAALFIAAFALPAQAQTKEAYVQKSADGTSITFYYDTQRATRPGTTYGINDTQTEHGYTYPAWTGTYRLIDETLKKAAFDPSFKDHRPTSTRLWFAECRTLQTIEGLTNLNTSEATDMSAMFYSCAALTAIDLSNFNTEQVTNMTCMFRGCQALTAIGLSNFNTEQVTDMGFMFSGCQALTAIDLSNFNTERVTDMSVMFWDCKALTTITCNDDWKRAGSNSYIMFNGCTKLKGAVPYDDDQTDATMANPATGYFTPKAPAANLRP